MALSKVKQRIVNLQGDAATAALRAIVGPGRAVRHDVERGSIGCHGMTEHERARVVLAAYVLDMPVTMDADGLTSIHPWDGTGHTVDVW